MFGLLTLIPGVVTGLLGWLNKKTDADLERLKTTLGADVALNIEDMRTRIALTQVYANTRDRDREHWSTAWMVPVAFGIFLFHASAVVFDSVPLLGHEVGSWKVAALPSDYAYMQTAIILTVCGVAGASFIKKIFGR
jgi:hypothetical protein